MADQEFWSDRIQRYKDQPEQRLQLALESLPYPAAFDEAAKALRSIIRTKRKRKEDAGRELQMLYDLAVKRSFLHATPYDEEFCEPGYNTAELVTKTDLQTVQAEWRTSGYKHVQGLLATDIKWMREAWGEPEAHESIRGRYAQIWERARAKRLAAIVRDENKVLSELGGARLTPEDILRIRREAVLQLSAWGDQDTSGSAKPDLDSTAASPRRDQAATAPVQRRRVPPALWVGLALLGAAIVGLTL